MRLPLIWRPGAVARASRPPTVTRPVGLVDLAPTFCAIAGHRRRRRRMQGHALPVDDADADARGFERVLTEWDSELFGVARAPAHDHARRLGVHRRTGPATCTTAPKASSTTSTTTRSQQHNRWDDPAVAALQSRPRRRPAGPPAGPSRTRSSRSKRRCERAIQRATGRVAWPGEDGGPRRTQTRAVGHGSRVGAGPRRR